MHRQALTKLLAAMAVGCLLGGCQATAPMGTEATSREETSGPAYEKARVQEEAASVRSPVTGLKAPDFALRDQNDKTVQLADLRGQWIVLYFYPQDDTPGCTCEATEFTKLLSELKGMKAKVYGVSADKPETHRIFIEKFKLSLELLSDPNHDMMRRYGAWVDAYLGDKKYERIIRTTMLIDPEGVIRYHWPEVIPRGHAGRVAEKLAMLQAKPKK